MFIYISDENEVLYLFINVAVIETQYRIYQKIE